jgi:hypothetical protein
MDDVKGVTRALTASTKSLDLGEASFFKLLDKDATIIKEDTKVKANVVHGFNSYRSAIMLWLRRTSIKEHMQGLKKDEMHASFIILKTTESEPKLFLMLKVMDEIFIKAHN